MGKVSLIVAKGRNRVIGKDNKLVWDLPGDLKHFKEKTLGKAIIMGRQTFESIGRVLPGRDSIILTRGSEFINKDVRVIRNIDDINQLKGEYKEVVIIGGESIYKQTMSLVDKMYITDIEEDFEGDTFFPKIDDLEWELVSWIKGKKDENNPYEYNFKEYKRIR